MNEGYTSGLEKNAGAGQRHAIVLTRWNSKIVEALKQGAISELTAFGVRSQDIEIFYVPGAFELGSTAKGIALTGRFASVICLGCVIRGDTDHYQFVAGEAARLIAMAAYDTQIPVIFGVLTTNTERQAEDRAGSTGNKGAEAAQTAIEMAALMARLKKP
ncbi:MAG: 6,7-dimethyl-8-ribityllumazine synthase [Spirochaetia bacterium]|nr:6,7-dimethyl-8-ribityllumazine synthase [Spirochaetia bacterium]